MAIAVYVGTALKGLLNNLEHRKVAAVVMAAEAVLKMTIFYIFLKFLPGNESRQRKTAAAELDPCEGDLANGLRGVSCQGETRLKEATRHCRFRQYFTFDKCTCRSK